MADCGRLPYVSNVSAADFRRQQSKANVTHTAFLKRELAEPPSVPCLSTWRERRLFVAALCTCLEFGTRFYLRPIGAVRKVFQAFAPVATWRCLADPIEPMQYLFRLHAFFGAINALLRFLNGRDHTAELIYRQRHIIAAYNPRCSRPSV